MALNSAQLIARALEAAKLKHYDKAKRLLEKILEAEPDHFDAIQFLGCTYVECGDINAAKRLLERAVQLDPAFPVVHMNLGCCCAANGDHSAAIEHFNDALQLRPNYPDALYNKALALKETGQLNAAIAELDRVTALAPSMVPALKAKSAILLAFKRVDEAVNVLEQALVHLPDSDELHAALAAALLVKGEPARALMAASKAVHRDEKKPLHLKVYGEALVATDNVDKAIETYNQAIRICARSITSNYNLAEVYLARAAAYCLKGMNEEAGRDRAAAVDSLLVEAGARSNAGRLVEALAVLEKAERLSVRKNDVLSAKVRVLYLLLRMREALAVSVELYESSPDDCSNLAMLCSLKARVCDWLHFESLVLKLCKTDIGGSGIPPSSLTSLLDNGLFQKAVAIECAGNIVKSIGPARPLPIYPKRQKIRIGYFSTDFNEHVVMQVIGEIFHRHDRSMFEVYGFFYGSKRDKLHYTIRKHFDAFHDIASLSDEDAVRLARREKIDIAIDLVTYTTAPRPTLFALRSAPVQVNFLGYPATSGASYIDYIIGDKIVIPEQNRQFFTEKVAYMPNSFMPSARNRVAGPAGTRSDHGLPEDAFVFCCFNQTYKITPQRFDLWAKILQRVDNSVLWLSTGDHEIQEKLRQHALDRNVDPKRLVFASRVDNGMHFGRHMLADLFLDTHPYNAHSTAVDAAWMGLPVLTRPGETFASRVAASVMTTAGAPELVVETDQDFIETAVSLAADPLRLKSIKARLLEGRTRSPLFDIDRFARDIEALYAEMYRRHHAGLPPDHIGAVDH